MRFRKELVVVVDGVTKVTISTTTNSPPTRVRVLRERESSKTLSRMRTMRQRF